MAVPLPQAYPASLKVGSVLYTVLAYTDDDGSHTEYKEWVVRSIKARRGTRTRMGHKVFAQGSSDPVVNLTQKVKDVTWVKRGGQYMWAKSISRWFRKQFDMGDRLPRGVYTTQRAALAFAIRVHERGLADYNRWIADETDDGEVKQLKIDRTSHEAELKALRIRFKKGWPK